MIYNIIVNPNKEVFYMLQFEVERIVNAVINRNGLYCLKGDKITVSPWNNGKVTVFVSNNLMRVTENISQKIQYELLYAFISKYDDIRIQKDEQGWLFSVHE